ncbi:hypothetical protein AM228_01825 [Planktothricoides sp. SR001]|nr:hypothetical protein AM228_01825 [Planktothricoides sp. SR001]
MFLDQPKDLINLINLINLIKLSRFSMDNLATAKSAIPPPRRRGQASGSDLSRNRPWLSWLHLYTTLILQNGQGVGQKFF